MREQQLHFEEEQVTFQKELQNIFSPKSKYRNFEDYLSDVPGVCAPELLNTLCTTCRCPNFKTRRLRFYGLFYVKNEVSAANLTYFLILLWISFT